jgi:hypothetical protein
VGTIVRALMVGVGVVAMLLGLIAIVSLQNDRIGGLWLVAFGGFLLVVVAAERQRYRSATAERANAPSGPGGGETTGEAVEARFRPTSEVFVDPTSGHRMRVLVDPATGERRYVAEA